MHTFTLFEFNYEKERKMYPAALKQITLEFGLSASQTGRSQAKHKKKQEPRKKRLSKKHGTLSDIYVIDVTEITEAESKMLREHEAA